MAGGWLVGEVLDADRFGNLVTSIPGVRLEALVGHGSAVFEVSGRSLRLVRSYDEGDDGTPAAIVGSTGRLEVFMKGGSASDALAARRGTPVRVTRGA
jgi:S-adenosylmethionine hydrolase